MKSINYKPHSTKIIDNGRDQDKIKVSSNFNITNQVNQWSNVIQKYISHHNRNSMNNDGKETITITKEKKKQQKYLIWLTDSSFNFYLLIDYLDPIDQETLTDWYNSLISNGTLVWNVTTDLCGQTGVTCDSSSPPRLQRLYSFLFFLLSSFFFNDDK